MIPIVLLTSNSLEAPSNTAFPAEVEVTNEEELKVAVSHDYCPYRFKAGQRSKAGFIKSNCIVMDVDNTHSDNPNEWKTPEDVAKTFPSVQFYVHYSRNNMKEKDGRSPRPKFHVAFPCDTIRNPEVYEALKRAINKKFPFFDRQTLDAARIFFGTPNPEVETHDGDLTIADVISIDELGNDESSSVPATPAVQTVISQGQRNSTMHTYAVKTIKRFGETGKAYNLYLNEAKKCSPQLGDDELAIIWRSAVNFYHDIVSSDPNYIPPTVYNGIPALPPINLKPKDYSDIGQARVVEAVNRDKMIYCEIYGYMVYDGTKWMTSEVRFQKLIQTFSGFQLKEALEANKAAQARVNLVSEDEKEAAKMEASKASAYLAHAKKYRSSASVAAVMKEIRPIVLIPSNKLDNKPYLLNTPAGTYDLALGMKGLAPHEAKDYLTQITAVSPSSEGEEIWNSFLRVVFCGDTEKIEFAQKLIGMAAIGQVMEECIYIAYGGGRNGKSSFFNSIRSVLGDYAVTINSDLLMGLSKNPDCEKAVLKGMRLAITSEVSEGATLSSKMLKNLTSTDEITSKRLYKAPDSFKPSHTLILCSNHLPIVYERDAGTWRRIKIIPFDAVIPESDEVLNYGDFLVKNAGGAILKWVIEGAQKAIDANFKLLEPSSIKEAVNAYRGGSDQIAAFIAECCEIGEEHSCTGAELYDAYKSYCESNGEKPRSNAIFAVELLKDCKFKKQRNSKGVVYEGLKIKE